MRIDGPGDTYEVITDEDAIAELRRERLRELLDAQWGPTSDVDPEPDFSDPSARENERLWESSRNAACNDRGPKADLGLAAAAEVES